MEGWRGVEMGGGGMGVRGTGEEGWEGGRRKNFSTPFRGCRRAAETAPGGGTKTPVTAMEPAMREKKIMATMKLFPGSCVIGYEQQK